LALVVMVELVLQLIQLEVMEAHQYLIQFLQQVEVVVQLVVL
jgi:hypothetical protein